LLTKIFVGLKPSNLEGLSLVKASDLHSVDVRWYLAVLISGVKYNVLT